MQAATMLAAAPAAAPVATIRAVVGVQQQWQQSGPWHQQQPLWQHRSGGVAAMAAMEAAALLVVAQAAAPTDSNSGVGIVAVLRLEWQQSRRQQCRRGRHQRQQWQDCSSQQGM
jgi:anti-sigma-K factor RskA